MIPQSVGLGTTPRVLPGLSQRGERRQRSRPQAAPRSAVVRSAASSCAAEERAAPRAPARCPVSGRNEPREGTASRRVVLQTAVGFLALEALSARHPSAALAAVEIAPGGLGAGGEEDFNYLEHEPTENEVDNVAMSTVSLPYQFMNTILGRGAIAAVCTCASETVTMPLDTIKVREQLRARGSGTPGIWTAVEIVEEGGVGALWKGLVPGLQHHFLSGGVKIGLYEPVKGVMEGVLGSTASPFLISGVSGMMCGVMGIAVCNPTDVVKVRMQGRANLAEGEVPISVLQEYIDVVKKDGVLGLWSGFVPNAARSGAVSGLSFILYDYMKQSIIFSHPEWGVLIAALLAGTVAGSVCGLVINPVDVVKINTMAQDKMTSFQIAQKLLQTEGPGSMLRGAVPSVVRVGCFDGLVFFFNESLRAWILTHL